MKKFFVLGLAAVSTVVAFIEPSYAQRGDRGMVFSTDGYSNIRSAPNAKVLRRCPNGAIIFPEPGYNYQGWLRIASGQCGTGYIHESQLIYPQGTMQAISRDGYSNVRSSPNGRIIGQISTGRIVEVYRRQGEWLMVASDDHSISGWVHQSQLR